MRSIKEVADYFKNMDPHTQMSEGTIRRMVSEGTIPAVKTGCKFLINLDLLLDKLGMNESVKKYKENYVCEKAGGK